MKLYSIIFSIIFFTAVGYTQSKLINDFNITNSKPYAVIDAKMKDYFSYEKFIYSIKTNEGKVTIQKFDTESMEEVARNKYENIPPYNKAIDIVEMGNKFYYLFESLDKKTKARTVHCSEINIENCSLGEFKVLFTSNGSVANGPQTEEIGFWGFKGGPPFSVHTSYDSSKVLIQYRRKPIIKDDDNNHDLIGLFVFDSSMKLIWGKETKMPYTENIMRNITYTVDSEGTAYIMNYLKKDRMLCLLSFDKSGMQTEKIIESNGFMFMDLFMRENKKGNLNFLGFYAKKSDYNFSEKVFGNIGFKTKGISYFELAKNGNVLNVNNTKFPIDLINQYEKNKTKKKNDRQNDKGIAGIPNIMLREFKILDDGSVFILGEKFYVVQIVSNGSTRYEFYYEHLIATKINSNGEVDWMKKLPKRQIGAKGKGGMSIAYLGDINSHYILFLDNVKNAEIDINEVPAKHVDGKGGYLTAYKISDKSGEISKHTLYNSEEVNGQKTYQFKTSRIIKTQDNKLFVEVYIKKKKDMMIKMELNE